MEPGRVVQGLFQPLVDFSGVFLYPLYLVKKHAAAAANLITILKYIILFSESKECVFIFKPLLKLFLSCLQFQLPYFKGQKLKESCTLKVHISPQNPDWLMITEYDIFHRVYKPFTLQ